MGANDTRYTRNAEVFAAIGAPGEITLDDRITDEAGLTTLTPSGSRRILNSTPAIFFGN